MFDVTNVGQMNFVRGRTFESSPNPDRDRAEKLSVKMIGDYHGLNVG